MPKLTDQQYYNILGLVSRFYTFVDGTALACLVCRAVVFKGSFGEHEHESVMGLPCPVAELQRILRN